MEGSESNLGKLLTLSKEELENIFSELTATEIIDLMENLNGGDSND